VIGVGLYKEILLFGCLKSQKQGSFIGAKTSVRLVKADVSYDSKMCEGCDPKKRFVMSASVLKMDLLFLHV
jgi:RNase P subunit RPR2